MNETPQLPAYVEYPILEDPNKFIEIKDFEPNDHAAVVLEHDGAAQPPIIGFIVEDPLSERVFGIGCTDNFLALCKGRITRWELTGARITVFAKQEGSDGSTTWKNRLQPRTFLVIDFSWPDHPERPTVRVEPVFRVKAIERSC